jgi:predicted nucleic acid-binding Zn ribbon protein
MVVALLISPQRARPIRPNANDRVTIYRRMRFVHCVMCNRPLEAKSSKRTFCTDACRMRAYRRRKQGIPETFLHDGAETDRGPVSLRARREKSLHHLRLLELGVEVRYSHLKALGLIR